MWTSAQLRPRRQLELEQVIVEEEEEEELEQVIAATRRSPTHISPKRTLTISETLREGNLCLEIDCILSKTFSGNLAFSEKKFHFTSDKGRPRHNMFMCGQFFNLHSGEGEVYLNHLLQQFSK